MRHRRNCLFVGKNGNWAKSGGGNKIFGKHRISIRLGLAKIGQLVHETCNFEDTGPVIFLEQAGIARIIML